MAKVLVVDDKAMMRDSVTTTLVREGFTAVSAGDGMSALGMIAKHRPSVVVTDLSMPGMDGIELLGKVMAMDPQLPVILMTAYATVETAVRAMKEGAFDYVQKPFDGDELTAAVKRGAEYYALRKENAALKSGGAGREGKKRLIGGSAVMEELRRQVERIAGSEGTVLISGESGTGKEVVAQMIHGMSGRRDSVMLCVNCAALSTSLLESELFGHEKGAFTGADQMRKGRFELAENGTLLLDEVSEIENGLQAKLLRVLQERQFERVGSSVTMDADVRVIATTNRDLEGEIEKGKFRQDLYYRLNVLPLRIPPLRARKGDIGELAGYFLEQQGMRDGGGVKRFSAEAMEELERYDWPGNVRELQNICERAGVLSGGELIDGELIRPWLGGGVMGEAKERLAHGGRMEGRTLEEMEREVIVQTLDRYSGHRGRTATALGIGVRTLGLKLKKWKELELVSESL